MDALIRRGRESDLPALRDILNHYILNTVVTFEMVELSLENRKTWFTQFSEKGLFVAEGRKSCLWQKRQKKWRENRICRQPYAFTNDQLMLPLSV